MISSTLARTLLGAALLASGPSALADEDQDWWEAGPTRWFLGGRADVGTYQHLGLAAGWGKPHWAWAGIEAHGFLTLDFGSASADVRLALPALDLTAGWRSTRTWLHAPLPDLPSQPTLPETGGFTYHSLDLLASGVLPTPGGLALWEVNAVRVLDAPPGTQIYEEWLRMVCAPPWCGVARLAWMASLAGDALSLGPGAEWGFLDGRSGRHLVRLGPVFSWQIGPHFELAGTIYWPVSDPDRFALIDRVNAAIVLGFTFATGDRSPRFP